MRNKIILTSLMLVLTSLGTAQVITSLEGPVQDNFDQDDYSYEGYHNRMQDSSDQLEPGAATERNWNLTDVFGEGYRVYNSRDSTPGPDNWGLSKNLDASIDNRGNVYLPGDRSTPGCYYQEDVSSSEKKTALMQATVDKRDKVFGNSFANARDPDNDGVDEGVWDDPDDWNRSTNSGDVPPEYMSFECDITGFDKGIGVDNGTDDNGVFRFKNDNQDSHVAIGDVAFVDEDGKSDTFVQEPPVCGDDHKEYLVEELGESENSMNNSGSFACSGRRDVCVARHGGSYAVYRQGDLVEADEASEEFGRSKDDKEFCETQDSDTRFGVWYDQDYSKEYCQNNDLYGDLGVRWINSSFIDKHPYAVREGLDDDMNPYLYNRDQDDYSSTQGDVSFSPGETPVPTGRNISGSIESYYSEYNKGSPVDLGYKDAVATKGFCGGDDSDEHLRVQEADTSLLDTNYSVIAIADEKSDCVLDGANYPDKINQTGETGERNVYSEGEQVTVDLGPSERQVTCFSGKWVDEWPVLFLQNSINVEESTTSTAEFQIINVQSTETEFDVRLDVATQLEPHTEFSQGGSQFTVTVPPEETEIYGVDIFGVNSSIGPEDINVSADATSSDDFGYDTIEADIIDEINQSQGISSANQTTSEVPGIGMIQLLFLASVAYVFYMSRVM